MDKIIAGLTAPVALMLGLAAAGARAEQLPLWEAGVGAVAFAGSPLVKDRQGVAVGFSIAWIVGESKTRVEVPR